MLHGDGEPLLIYYEDEYTRFCYAVMKRDISEFPAFQGRIEKKSLYDLETPYGYGGPLTDGLVLENSQRIFRMLMTEYCMENHIISQFVRFHPLLLNHGVLSEVIETRYLRDTIYIATESPEVIMKNMESKSRNMVRKAKKSGVTTIIKTIGDYQAFLPIYVETMAKNHADEYYTFQREYFESLKQLDGNACIFYAMLDGEPISASIMLFNDRYIHYHLSGTHTKYKQYAPGNLLLYEAACWASEKKIQKFHLGGGMTSNDSLFNFKKQFNKFGRAPFVVGRTIFDLNKYDELRRLRKELDSDFDMDNEFMIQYRW